MHSSVSIPAPPLDVMPPPPVTAAPPFKTPAEKLENAALFSDIRHMLDSCHGGTNAHDRVTIAIMALIDRGVNTGPRIVGAAKQLGFDRSHAAIVLANQCGTVAARHDWSRGDDGIYTLLA